MKNWDLLTQKEKCAVMDGLVVSRQSLSRINKKILLRAEDPAIESSKHGVFNPTCCYHNGMVHSLIRSEPNDKTWQGHFLADKAVPLYAESEIRNKTIQLDGIRAIETGMPAACRPEDWRLFSHNGTLYTNFTNYFYYNKGYPQKQTMSRTALGMVSDDGIIFLRELDASSQLEMQREEKNWVFFSENRELFCVYSVEPFVVLNCDSTGRVKRAMTQNIKLPRLGNRYIANSTNPILVKLAGMGSVYLMFVHQYFTPIGDGQRNRTYYQHALIFSQNDHRPIAWTPKPIAGGGSHLEGRHNGVVYFSGALEDKNDILVMEGEGDSHSSQYTIPKQEIIDNLQAI
jgi:predicted GH43/DUF377 family glycosyl hydrolase